MSNSTRALIGLVFLAVVAGCTKKEETVFVEQPITQEPVSTGKY